MKGLIPLCAAAALALVATIGWEVASFHAPSPDTVPARSPVTGVVPAATADDPAAIAQGWVDTALERPLFREGRRPEPASGAVAEQERAPPRLAGILTGPFGNRAIFMLADNPKPVLAKQGDTVNGFVIRSIEPGRAVVEVGGATRILTPSFAETVASTGASGRRATVRPGTS